MNYERPELLERLAGEYVLGTLSARARRRFATLRRLSPAVDRAALDWERSLLPLAQSVPPAALSASVWEAIERRTGTAEARPAAASSGWRSWWKAALGLAFGLVLALGLVRLYPGTVVPFDQIVQERGALPASYVGLLTDADGNPVMLASATRHGRKMSIKVLRKIDVPSGKVLRLWALPKDGAAFALGEVPGEGKGSFEMAESSEKLLSNVPRLAVSVEDSAVPAQPSPFILSGHCVKLW